MTPDWLLTAIEKLALAGLEAEFADTDREAAKHRYEAFKAFADVADEHHAGDREWYTTAHTLAGVAHLHQPDDEPDNPGPYIVAVEDLRTGEEIDDPDAEAAGDPVDQGSLAAKLLSGCGGHCWHCSIGQPEWCTFKDIPADADACPHCGRRDCVYVLGYRDGESAAGSRLREARQHLVGLAGYGREDLAALATASLQRLDELVAKLRADTRPEAQAIGTALAKTLAPDVIDRVNLTLPPASCRAHKDGVRA